VGAACGIYGKEEKLCGILALDIEVDYLEDEGVGGKMMLKCFLVIKANTMPYFCHIYLIKYSTCFGQVHCPSSGISHTRSRYLSC
jgi:hypothetical protein